MKVNRNERKSSKNGKKLMERDKWLNWLKNNENIDENIYENG